MTGPEAASTTAGDACQQARCCRTLASGSWNSKQALSLARDSDPSFGRRQKQGRKSGTRGWRSAGESSLGNFPTVDLELTKVSLESCSRSRNGGRSENEESERPGTWEVGVAASKGDSCSRQLLSLLSSSHDGPRWG
jgi:hypothetical protein